MKIVTNTTKLTEKQEETLWFTTRDLFESKVKEEATHFSFLGTRLNLKSRKVECVFEACTENTDFVVLVDLNESKKVLKNTVKVLKD